MKIRACREFQEGAFPARGSRPHAVDRRHPPRTHAITKSVPASTRPPRQAPSERIRGPLSTLARMSCGSPAAAADPLSVAVRPCSLSRFNGPSARSIAEEEAEPNRRDAPGWRTPRTAHRPEKAAETVTVPVGAGRREGSLTTRCGRTERGCEKPLRSVTCGEFESHTPPAATRTTKFSSTFKLFSTLGT